VKYNFYYRDNKDYISYIREYDFIVEKLWEKSDGQKYIDYNTFCYISNTLYNIIFLPIYITFSIVFLPKKLITLD